MGLRTFDTVKRLIESNSNILSDEEVKELQSLLTMMLRDFNSFCTKNNINYTLGGGTCLGAVRRKGFIPWDDDIDLNMSRRDFERLKVLFEKDLGQKYVLDLPNNASDYDLSFPKIRLKGTIVRGLEDLDKDDCGAFLDIFVIENIPNNIVLRLLHGFGSMALGFICSCRRFEKYSEIYLSLTNKGTKEWRQFLIKSLIGKLLSFKSAGSWAETWDRWNSLCDNSTSRFISIPTGRRHYFGETQLRDDYFPVSLGIFEGMVAPLPNNYEKYMKALYGSGYMTPPPASKREKHLVYEFDLGQYKKTPGEGDSDY